MRVIPPIDITPSMLISTTAVETAPVYASGTTYPLGDYTVTGTVGQLLTVWKSLQAANTGHTPSSSPTWWLNVGTTYSVYSTAVTYALGDRVIDTSTHLVWESQISGANLNQPLGVGTAWLKVGPTNKFAALDQLRNTQVIQPIDIVQTIQLTKRADSIAVIGVDGASIHIEMKVAGVTKYNVTSNLVRRMSRTWKQYFYGEFSTSTSVQFFDLPPYRNATITVTVSKPAAGQRGVGGIIIGNAVYLGRTQYEAVRENLNFTLITRSELGDVEITPRRTVPKLNSDVFFDKSMTPQILAAQELLNGRPAFWSGLDDATDSYFPAVSLYGPYKEYSLNLKDFDEGKLTLEVEEM